MVGPSIKGTGFASAVEDLQALLESGRLTRDRLELRLEAADLAIVDGKILPGDWYPIETYTRVLAVLGEVEGKGDPPGYFARRGHKAAERLMNSGIYRQLEKAQRLKEDGAPEARESWVDRVGRLMITLAPALFSFSKWRFEARRGGFRIEVTEASPFPEAARFTIQGVIEYATRALNESSVAVTSRRPSADLVIYEAQTGP